MAKTKKRRRKGRPKIDNPRVQMSWSYSRETIEMLDELVERYKVDAPSCLELSPRLVIEAVLERAHRENLSFCEAFGIPAGSAATEE